MASTRRLAAIMFTDTVGSTAAAQENESRALELRDEQARLIRPLFAAHQGREIKSMGDGFLVEFDSALRAVQCAIDIQEQLHERNTRAATTPIQLRIGVHLGDVEQRDADIVGDAVNIASRVEPLAVPGGICISGEVFSQVHNKIPNKLEKLPPTSLKGVLAPVDVYRVALVWNKATTPEPRAAPTGLAVLPFSNISPDPSDEYFAEGLTEELITALSQLKGLRVIARTSVMQYKGTAKGVSQIGSELRVSSVLEGSVRKAGNRLRVTAQLIDVSTEGHLWAHTYDRELNDIFAVQSELASQVAEALKVELLATEVARLGERPAIRPDSYVAYLKGRSIMRAVLGGTEASVEDAAKAFQLAISLDDRNAAAYSGLADSYRYRVYSRSGKARAEVDRAGREAAARALELDPNLAEAHVSLGVIIWDDFEYAAAEKEYQRALALNPSYSFAHSSYALLLQDEGRPEEAVREHELAEAADPFGVENLILLARLLSWLGRFDEAWTRIEKVGALTSKGEGYYVALAWYYRGKADAKLFAEADEKIQAFRGLQHLNLILKALQASLSGDKDRARQYLREHEASRVHHYEPAMVAMAYADIGDLDESFRWLERAFLDHAVIFQPFRLDPRLEGVRRDPRFLEFLKKANLA